MKYRVREFSILWWAVLLLKASVFLGIFLAVVNLVG